MSNAALNAVWCHSAAAGSARLVLLAMADEANDEGELTAYHRSQTHLATKANVDPKTVPRAIARLQELREVEVLAAGGGRAQTDYRITLPGLGPREPRTPPPANRGGSAPPQHAEAPPAARGGSPREPRRQPPTNRGVHHPLPSPSTPSTPSIARPVQLGAFALLQEPPPRTTTGDLAFDEFWRAYPRHVAKGAARKAWRPALARASGDAAVIVAGARRYAADPNREDRFTAHPSTWLNQDRWLDEDPLPDRGDGNRTERSLRRLAAGAGAELPDAAASVRSVFASLDSPGPAALPGGR